MINFKIKTSFVMPEGPKILANKLILILDFIICENYLHYNSIHDFSVWLRAGSNPAYINQFRYHNGNIIKTIIIFKISSFTQRIL